MHEHGVQLLQSRSGPNFPPAETVVLAAPLDLLMFTGAIAVIGAHAAVDSFIVPEPGTGPSDHLLRGLATFSVLALAVVVYSRLPAGGRAALAAVLGALALEGAGLAIADARAVGVRGEGWTGFLLLPVGVALLALSAALLWRSRKTGQLRYLRRAGIAAAAVLMAYWLVIPVAIAILATHRPRADVAPADFGTPYEVVTIRTSDGLDLAAWYVPSRNGAAVISYPTRQGKLPHARMLVRHGYGVLLLDARGYDASEGDPNLFGWASAKDIDAAVTWLRSRPDVTDARIGGIGFSVGGEVLLQAAASNTGLRRRRLGRRRRALGARALTPRAARLVLASRGRCGDRGGRDHERQRTTALTRRSCATDLPAAALPHLRRPGWRRRGTQSRLLPSSFHQPSDLEDRRGRARGRIPSAPARVRAARDALLRPRATWSVMTKSPRSAKGAWD